jgi:hypothetical protein
MSEDISTTAQYSAMQILQSRGRMFIWIFDVGEIARLRTDEDTKNRPAQKYNHSHKELPAKTVYHDL